MINPIGYFVLSSIIVVIGVSIFFKIMVYNIGKVEKPSLVLQKLLNQFFISVFLIDIFPIILIVIGFVRIDSLESFQETTGKLPSLVVLLILVAGVINIVMDRTLNLLELPKSTINTITVIGLILISTIPLLSLVVIQ